MRSYLVIGAGGSWELVAARTERRAVLKVARRKQPAHGEGKRTKIIREDGKRLWELADGRRFEVI